jgi:hypothetical protein
MSCLTIHTSVADVHNLIRSPQASTEKSVVPTRTMELSVAIGALYVAKKAYSESKLPPIPRTSYKRWTPEASTPAPHDPNAYFPMELVR